MSIPTAKVIFVGHGQEEQNLVRLAKKREVPFEVAICRILTLSAAGPYEVITEIGEKEAIESLRDVISIFPTIAFEVAQTIS